MNTQVNPETLYLCRVNTISTWKITASASAFLLSSSTSVKVDRFITFFFFSFGANFMSWS